MRDQDRGVHADAAVEEAVDEGARAGMELDRGLALSGWLNERRRGLDEWEEGRQRGCGKQVRVPAVLWPRSGSAGLLVERRTLPHPDWVEPLAEPVLDFDGECELERDRSGSLERANERPGLQPESAHSMHMYQVRYW